MTKVKESGGGCSEENFDMYPRCRISMGGGLSGIVKQTNQNYGWDARRSKVGWVMSVSGYTLFGWHLLGE